MIHMYSTRLPQNEKLVAITEYKKNPEKGDFRKEKYEISKLKNY